MANKTKEASGNHRLIPDENGRMIGNIIFVESEARHSNFELTEPGLFIHVSPWPNVTEHYLRKVSIISIELSFEYLYSVFVQ